MQSSFFIMSQFWGQEINIYAGLADKKGKELINENIYLLYLLKINEK